MKTGLILHGTPNKEEYYDPAVPAQSNAHWIPWLQNQMVMSDIVTQAPEMPFAFAPDYTSWKETFEQFNINQESIIIGHSCGGGFLLKYFSENKINVKRIVLVAPWLDPLGELDDEVVRKMDGFFDFDIDPDITKRSDLHMIYSDDDMKSIQISVDTIKSKIPDIQSREFKNYGHFCLGDMGTEEFPDLRDLVLKD